MVRSASYSTAFTTVRQGPIEQDGLMNRTRMWRNAVNQSQPRWRLASFVIFAAAACSHAPAPSEEPVPAEAPQSKVRSSPELVSAMHEGLAQHQSDVSPAFGGKRVKPHPTHACPGDDAAMGVLLGVLAAFVDVREQMRPSPAPLAFTFEGSLA